MEAVIDKNMLRANGWDGDSSNIFLAGGTGLGPSGMLDLDTVDSDCFSVEDGNGNYRLRIDAPFMGKCGTDSTIQGQDYLFTNQVKWRMQTSFSVKEAELLDFKCTYQGKCYLHCSTELSRPPSGIRISGITRNVYVTSKH